MPAVSLAVVAPRGGEIVGDAPHRRVEILSDIDGLHATWTRFGPGTEGADLHVHRRHTDLFYVLSGELTVRLGVEDDQVAVPSGTLVRLPPMVVHGFRNASAADVTYLNLHAPGVGFADFMRSRRDGTPIGYDQEPPPADGVRPAGDAAIGGDVDEERIRVHEVRDGRTEHVEGWTASYFALDGPLDVRIEGEERQAPEGAWVQVASGVAHVASGARFLAVRTPG